jgi:cell division protein FtsZ
VQEQAHEDANIIFGASIDETLGESVKVTVIATGFEIAERELVQQEAQRTGMPSSMSMPTLSSRALSASRMGTNHAPSVSSRAPSHPAPAQHGSLSSQPAHGAESRTHAAPAPVPSHVAPAARPALRERPASSFPSSYDTDWDVPAFQRKQQ